jgi:hypothetical protein
MGKVVTGLITAMSPLMVRAVTGLEKVTFLQMDKVVTGPRADISAQTARAVTGLPGAKAAIHGANDPSEIKLLSLS